MRLLCTLFLLLLAVPTQAQTNDGFGKFKWGMTPDEARSAYPNQVRHDPEAKNPEGTAGGAFNLVGGPKLFEQAIDVSCYFGKSGLSIIRVTFREPKDGNIQRVIDWNEPKWGKPIVNTKRIDATRSRREWSWPWEGVALREAKDDGRIKYQRLDFSSDLHREWRNADTAVCSILPRSSNCSFSDRFCAQQDSSMARGRREQSFPIGRTEGQLACKYKDYEREDVRLTIERPTQAAAEWLLRILTRRLGDAEEARTEDADTVMIQSTWERHGISLRVVRKIKGKKKSGKLSGPVTYMRVKRKIGSQ